MEAEGVGGKNGPAAGGGPAPYPISRAPTGIHDNTSSGSGGGGAAMRGRYGGAGAAAADPSDPSNELRNFHGTASEISRDISATSAMLSELASLAHWLKGSAGSVGFDSFTDPAAVLERFALDGDGEGAREQLLLVLDMASRIEMTERDSAHA